MHSIVKVVSRNNNVTSSDEYADINGILDTFANIASDRDTNSVISQAFKKVIKNAPEIGNAWSNTFYTTVFNTLNGIDQTKGIAYVPTNKTARIFEYERMCRNSEVDACLDEIADSAINFNEKKQCIEINFNDIEYIGDGVDAETKEKEIETKKEVLYKEFYKFISPLKIKNKLHRYVKNFLKTGECCWENVIDPEKPELGIVDFVFIPTHSFDFAYDKVTHEKLGLWVKVLKTRPGATLNFDVDASMVGGVHTSGLYSSNMTGRSYDLSGCNRFDDYYNGDLMFLPFDQVTYVESGEHSPDELIVYPLVEKARRAFNQLMCVEDAIIIYRLARSPTRLVFNVGVGMATASKAHEQIQKLIRQYNVSMHYNSATGMSSTRDAHTMTESYWFPKSANGEGTDVSELSSSVNMGDLVDLEYFQKKLWKALHVPAKRFTDGGETLNKNPSNEMTADEYKFCKFLIRILLNFSDAIKETFLTHLKLTGLDEKLSVDESFFDIHFVNPLSYELYEQGRVLQQRIEMYKAITEDGETFSKTIAMQKYLNFTSDEIEENWKELEKEAIRKALIEAKAQAVADDEGEAYKKRLQAERNAKTAVEYKIKTYDSTEDVVDDATTVRKSNEVIRNGVEQMSSQDWEPDESTSQQGEESGQEGSENQEGSDQEQEEGGFGSDIDFQTGGDQEEQETSSQVQEEPSEDEEGSQPLSSLDAQK